MLIINNKRKLVEALTDIIYKIYNRLEKEKHLTRAVIEQDCELLYKQLYEDLKQDILSELNKTKI